jgi:hypothetical protein
MGEEIAEPAGDLPTRSEREDIAILKRDYPRLYRKIMEPTWEQIEAKRLKKMIRALKAQGLGYDEIRERIGDRIPACMPAVKPEMPEVVPSPERRMKRRQVISQPEPEPKEKEVRSIEELISSIQLSDAVRKHIRDADLSAGDVLFSICKGFNLGGGKTAAGGAHFRGVYVRTNIRNYLKRRYAGRKAEAPKVDDLLSYIKSVDLIIDAGSSKYTKTKDEAMSLNTNPSHAIGNEIMRTINAALVGYRQR